MMQLDTSQTLMIRMSRGKNLRSRTETLQKRVSVTVGSSYGSQKAFHGLPV